MVCMCISTTVCIYLYIYIYIYIYIYVHTDGRHVYNDTLSEHKFVCVHTQIVGMCVPIIIGMHVCVAHIQVAMFLMTYEVVCI